MWLGISDASPRPVGAVPVGAVPVGAVIDTEVRNPRIDRWIMTVHPPVGAVSECWVEFAPGVGTGRQETVTAVFADSPDVIVVPWIRLDEFARNPFAELAGRPQASAWIVAGLLIGAMGWLISWFRRPQIGLYRAVGTGPSALLVLGGVELAIPIISGALIRSFWAAALWTAGAAGYPSPDQFAIALGTTSSTVLLALAVSPLRWPLTARGSIANQLKSQ